jgi:hypothetical protein
MSKHWKKKSAYLTESTSFDQKLKAYLNDLQASQEPLAELRSIRELLTSESTINNLEQTRTIRGIKILPDFLATYYSSEIHLEVLKILRLLLPDLKGLGESILRHIRKQIFSPDERVSILALEFI